MNNNKLTIKQFIIKYKLSFILTFLLTFILYGIKLMTYSISIDTEIIINSYNEVMNYWLSINRFTLILLKKFLHLKPFNYYQSISIMIIFFSLSIYYLYYIIYKYSNDHQPSNLKIILFNFLIISSQIFAEQFNLTLQCAEIAISLFIFDIGISLYFRYFKTQRKILLIGSILCFTLCLGCYQTFMNLLITLLIFYLLINYSKDQQKKVRRYIVISFITIILTFLLYSIISKIMIDIQNLTSNNYLLEQITWFSKPITYNIIVLIKYMVKVFIGYGIFYSLSYLLSFIIITINIMKNKQNKFYILLNILCLLSPFLLSILLGTPEATRAQLTLPIITSLVIIFINSSTKKKIITLLTILIIIIQAYNTLTLLHDDSIRYEEDKKMANDIIKKVGSNIKNKKIIFVGHKNNNSKLKKGDSLGASFFNWDVESIYGINIRAIGFMKTLGYKLENPTLEEYYLAKKISLEKNLTTYPNNNSIYQYENLIIIKLSN